MKKTILSIAAAAMLFAVSACESHIPEQVIPIGKISFTATQTSGSSFQEGDSFSAYIWTGEDTQVPETFYLSDVRASYEAETDEWLLSPEIHYQDQSTPHHFVAISPSPAQPIEDLHAYRFKLDEHHPERNDLMVALNTKGLTESTTPVELEFEHLTTQVFINCIYYGDHTEIEKEFSIECPTSGILDCAGKDGKPVITLDPEFHEAPFAEISKDCYEGHVFGAEHVNKLILRTSEGTQGRILEFPLEAGTATTINLFWKNDRIESHTCVQGKWDENIKQDPENSILPGYVYVNAPGSLTRAQIDEALGETAELNICGFLNGADLKVLREAAGCHHNYMSVPDKNAPVRRLNLRHATIIASNDMYAQDDFMGESFRIKENNVLPDVAFANSVLESLYLPEDLKGIGNKVLFGSRSLTQLEMSDTPELKFILEMAFCNTGLESLTIPASVDQIGYSILRNCPMHRLQLDCDEAAEINTAAFMDFEQAQCDLYLNQTWSKRITTDADGKTRFDGLLWKSVNVQ